jgi:hypothetical protein
MSRIDIVRQDVNRREQLKMIARQLDEAKHGAKSKIALAHAVDLGVSVPTLYRMLERDVAWDSGRKTRVDKGTTIVSDEALAFVGAAQKVSRRQNGKQVLAATTATSLAIQHGIHIGVGADRVQRLLKERGLDAETQAQDSPPIQLRSLHPNHVHMVDPSLCLIYYMNGQQHIIREDVAYKNKPEALNNVKLKVWRYVLIDHFSHWICVTYFEAKGETQDSLFRFLMHAWSDIDGRKFHGVPELLMMDPGSANTAYAIRNVCEALEVKLQINKPGQPRAKGAVEVAQDIVETQFESLLKFQPVLSVEELNDFAFAWCNAYNANMIKGYDSRLKRPGMMEAKARTDLWLKIKPEQLRLCPPVAVCSALMLGAIAEPKVSNGLLIGYKHPLAPCSRKYDLRGIREIRAGDRVKVRPLVYGDEAVIIELARYDGTIIRHRIEPVRNYDEAGFRLDAPVIGQEYKAMPMHEAERDGQRLDEIAYGVDADGVIRDREAIERAKKDNKATPFAGELRPLDALKGIELPTYLPKKGTVIVPKMEPVEPIKNEHLTREDDGSAIHVAGAFNAGRGDKLSVPQLAKRLKDDLGEWDALRYTQLAERWPDGAFDDEYNAVLSWFTGRGRMQVVK